MATARVPTRAGGAARTALSFLWVLLFLCYLTLVVEPLNWLVIGPLVTLRPGLRTRVVGAWLRSQVSVCLWVFRSLAGLRYTVRGSLPAGSVIVVMNHQSLFDIPLAFGLIRGPCPVIPTRSRYKYTMPGASSMMRLMGCPFVTSGRKATPDELLALRDAADATARGERTFLIFPEGHRTRNGDVQPFKPGGLRLLFGRTPGHPVYLVAVDGLTGLHSLPDMASRVAGTTARLRVDGPYHVPPSEAEIPAFIESLHSTLSGLVAELRSEAREAAPEPPHAAVG